MRPVFRSLALLLCTATLLASCGNRAPPTTGGDPGARLLTEPQYRSVIADIFGAQITIGGSFDPLVRTNGLLTVGASQARVTPAGLEQFDRMARSVAAQVTDAEHRAYLVGCAPQDEARPDDRCSAEFLGRVGRLLYRRPLGAEELAARVGEARLATHKLGNFYDGLAATLSGMLVSPQFLFVIDGVEPSPNKPGAMRLDGYSKAARLSFFLWGTAPDDELLRAAERGELHDRRGLERQVERLLDSPRVEAGLRMFFDDMLAFEDIARIEKDSIIYPAFSAAVAADAREQTLRTIMRIVLQDKGDYRDIFTTRKTYVSGALGRIYHVPVDRPDGGWTSYEFPAGDPRVGIVSHVSFTALHSHAGRSSPTLRGRALRELLLCQKVPDPPGNVDFSKFNDPDSPAHTARERLSAHALQPACAGCHKITDPVGLGMEHLDGAGQLRTAEGGVAIDARGTLDGIAFNDVGGIGPAMHDNPAAPACLVDRLYAYAIARPTQRNERKYLKYLEQQFERDQYRVPDLLHRIAISDALYAVRTPAEPAPALARSTP